MDQSVDDELRHISQSIRSGREAAGLTLQELAKKSGVATSTIQKVETEQMIPSIAVVLKIASGLGKGPADLIGIRNDAPEIVHLRQAERHRNGLEKKMLVERLSGDLFESSIEMWRVTMYPGVSSGKESILYNGEELIVCEEGTLYVEVGTECFSLDAGDTLHFRASIPHRWRNKGKTPVRFSITGTRPKQFRAAMHKRVANAASS